MAKSNKTTAFPRFDSADLVGVRARRISDLINQIERGLSVTALEKLGKTSGFTIGQLRIGIGMSERTLARRRKTRKLTSKESNRLFRVARVFSLAVHLFEGEIAMARKWFLAPNRAFDGRSPFKMIQTEIGAGEVENLIGRIEHGVFC